MPDPNEEQSMEMKSIVAAANDAVRSAECGVEKARRLRVILSVHSTG